MKVHDSYYGGKGSNGTYQTLINMIPPCTTLIIPFLGNCAILRNIKLPLASIAIDIDTAVIKLWRNSVTLPGVTFINTDAISFLRNIPAVIDNPSTVIYCDPPYPILSRRHRRSVYRHEMTERNHGDLLSTLLPLRSRVLISTLSNALYSGTLSHWNCVPYMNKTRRGMQKELLYFNFDNSSSQLQDYRYIGNNFRQREIIKRRQRRWYTKFKSLSLLEKNAMIDYLLHPDESHK